jgi:hypothetical protein
MSGASIQATGRVGQFPSLDDINIDLTLNAKDVSRLLPASDSSELTAHPFAASASVSMVGNELKFERLDASFGSATLEGNVGFVLDPMLDSGQFDLIIESPNLGSFFPPIELDVVPEVVNLKYRGSGSWSGNFWNIEEFRLELDEGYFEFHGTIDGPPTVEQTDLSIDLQLQHISNLSMIAGRELPDEVLRLKGHLLGSREEMSMQDFELTLGDSDLQGQFSVRFDDVPVVDVDLTSTLLNLAAYLPVSDDEVEQTSEPVPAIASDRLIPDTPLPLELLRTIDAALKIGVGELRLGRTEVSDIIINTSLASGALRIKELSFTTLGGGSLSLSASLLPNAMNAADLSIAASGAGFVLDMLAETDQDKENLPRIDLETELTANGATVREISGSLDGFFHAVGHEGPVPADAMSFFAGDLFAELLSSLNPFAASDSYTRVECSVLAMNFDDGKASGEPSFVFQTNKLRIFANSKVDLKTEALDVNFRIVPRKGLGVSLSGLVNPYIRLTGTLVRPALILDPERLLVEGGVAVATAGLSILAKGLKDRYLSDKDPCGTAIETARATQSKKSKRGQ